jgi:hypothetical protein
VKHSSALSRHPVKNSPQLKHIVNIYSVNSYKKKKFALVNNNNSGIQLQAPSEVSGNSYKDDINAKLKLLRDGIGYYEKGIGGSLSRVQNGLENHKQPSQNNSLMLPELNHISPQIYVGKQ